MFLVDECISRGLSSYLLCLSRTLATLLEQGAQMYVRRSNPSQTHLGIILIPIHTARGAMGTPAQIHVLTWGQTSLIKSGHISTPVGTHSNRARHNADPCQILYAYIKASLLKSGHTHRIQWPYHTIPCHAMPYQTLPMIWYGIILPRYQVHQWHRFGMR